MSTMDQTRPTDAHKRSKSSFSFRSNKSDKSDPSRPRVDVGDLHESEKERQKSKFNITTNRDPNSAMRDAQPADRMNDANTLPEIRQTQYKDWKGDPIVDADASNPTRSRLERPLDTIRSFEAAIDNEWKRKSTTVRTDSADVTQYSSRRNSYAAGYDAPYGNRNGNATPMSAQGGPGRSAHRHNDHYAQRPANPRYQTSPAAHNSNGQNVSPTHGYSQSYDTVDTGGSYGTSGSEAWGYSTDPSSENSSIERAYGINGHKPEHQDMHGGQHRRESPRHNAIQEEYGFDGSGYTQGEYNGPYNPPAPPRHSGQWGGSRPMNMTGPQGMGPPAPSHQPQRNVIPLGGSNGPAPPPKNKLQQRPQMQQQSSSGDGKRKSWLKRRFSKG